MISLHANDPHLPNNYDYAGLFRERGTGYGFLLAKKRFNVGDFPLHLNSAHFPEASLVLNHRCRIPDSFPVVSYDKIMKAQGMMGRRRKARKTASLFFCPSHHSSRLPIFP